MVPGPPANGDGLGLTGFSTGFDGPTGSTFVPLAPPQVATSVPPSPLGLSPVAPPLPPSPESGVGGPPGVPGSGLPEFSLGILLPDTVSLTSLPPTPQLVGEILSSSGKPLTTTNGRKTYRKAVTKTWKVCRAMHKRIEAAEMWLYRRMLKIPWPDEAVNEEVTRRANTNRELINMIQKRKLKFFGHLVRLNNIHRTLLEGKIKGKRSRGRPIIQWIDNIKK